MMPPDATNPASAAAPTGSGNTLLGSNTPDHTKSAPQKQALIEAKRDVVAAAVKRHRERLLLDIKRGSLWTVAAAARCHLDGILWSLEEAQFDEVFPCAEAFVEHARAVAKLANDFESERRAVGQTGGSQ
jgi:hypothetical protein